MKYKYKKLDYNTEDLESLSNSELKKLADYWLRQYLLKNATGFGERIWCPIKKQSYHKDKIQVAHFIDRACMNTRYDLDNCHLISEQSNSWDCQVKKEGYKSLHHYEYEMWLGEEKVKNLIEKSKIIRRFSKNDYIEIINNFKNECKI